MNRISKGALALTVLLGASYVACTSKTPTNDYALKIVGDGQTCGIVQENPQFEADCANDAGCLDMFYSYTDAGNSAGVSLGICSPDLPACDGTQTCPSGTDCADIMTGVSTFHRCLTKCNTSDDCEAPFQFCEFNHCRPLQCTSDTECEDGRCSEALCVRGDASTQ